MFVSPLCAEVIDVCEGFSQVYKTKKTPVKGVKPSKRKKEIEYC